MINKRKSVYGVSLVALLSATTFANPTQAQSKSEIALSCIQAIEAGDNAKATELGKQMVAWRSLFATNVIRNAEKCLQATTGEHWKYFSTKGGFLAGDDAMAEQAFIDGAGGRKVARAEDLKLRTCETALAQFELDALEAEYANIRAARTVETRRATYKSCAQLYEQDPGAALLNEVCNNVFQNFGMPDTLYEFDNNKIDLARIKVAVSGIKLLKASNESLTKNDAITKQLSECQQLIEK